ncbi:hypothetical protein CBS9595_003930 [Malassezia furfur]|nr:hypothetical protein CBS9595_003930 [Malassezia furfur]
MTAPDNSLPTPPAKGNESYVLLDVEKTVFEDRPVAPLAPYEVRVNVRQTGLCGSDCHYKMHGRIGDFVLRKPMVLGHESSGIITAVGSDVTDRRVGDRVALEPGVPCCMCALCLAGHYSHCEKLVFAATPPYDGTLATYYNLRAAFAHPIPDNMSLEAASLMEPLSVAVHAAVTLGRVRALENVLVFGAGPIGLLCAAVARAYGAKRVVCVDLVDEKLAFAQDFCATSTFKTTPPNPEESAMDCSRRNAEALVAELGEDVAENGGFDLALEATGAQSCLQMACWAMRTLGRIVAIPITRMMVREVSLVGSFRYCAGDYDKSIALASTGKIDVERLVTHRYLFKDADKAFDTTARGKGEDGKACIKVQICQGAAPEV